MAEDTQAISIRFPPALYERLRRAGFDHRVPMNTIVVDAVEHALDAGEHEEAPREISR